MTVYLFQEYEELHLAIFTATYKVRNHYYTEESVVIGRVTNKRNKCSTTMKTVLLNEVSLVTKFHFSWAVKTQAFRPGSKIFSMSQRLGGNKFSCCNNTDTLFPGIKLCYTIIWHQILIVTVLCLGKYSMFQFFVVHFLSSDFLKLLESKGFFNIISETSHKLFRWVRET